jgi:phosphonopyruvate decarboxylase
VQAVLGFVVDHGLRTVDDLIGHLMSSVGGQPTVGFEMNLPAVAKAYGYRDVVSVSEAADVKKEMARLREMEGPVLLEVRANKGARDDLGRPKTSPIENRDAFMGRLGVRED